ncbi:MAG: DUF4956 domain-containing protein [Bacteroidales bacterium]|nr:DUF4956 domain-containing protein [Bacteroidales bacterium]MCF8389151.1 DUF4956 domain-containing protein [Bacteroidales bacterium]
MTEFLNIELMNWEDFSDLLFRSTFNLIIIAFVVRYLYYRQTPRKDYLFTYILISVVVFFMVFLLENVKLELGFALGLFAIFGIIRYRTQQMPIREMTYLFLVIGISVINALANAKVSYAELIFTNIALVLITFLLERVFLLRHESRKAVEYENIELIKPENRAALLLDLQTKTGLKINRVEIGRIDFLRDSARVFLYYFESDNTPNFADDNNGNVDDGDDD